MPERDGRVAIADVVRLLRWSVGLEPAPIDDDLIRADIGSGSASPEARGDGRVDIGDVVRALRLSVDLEVVDWPARSSFEGRGPCAPALVELHHEGDLPLMLLDLELEGDASGDWLVEGPPLPHELAPDDVVVLRLVFVPTMPGARQAQLRVTTDDEEVPEQLVSLEGLGVAPGPPRLEVLPTELSFGELPLAMTSGPGLLVVSNAGGEPLVLTSLELNGPDAPDFDLEPPVLPLELAVGGRVELLVTVTPSLSGLRQAELIVESSEPDGPTVVPLTVVSLPPVSFAVEEVFEVATPTRGVWGPDERLWVATIGGAIHALSFDDDWALQDVETFDALTELPNPHVLGLAFSPFDAPGALRLLVAHSLLEANGGECFEGSSDFTGQVSVLTGPDFDEVEPLITGLPVSNHDHGINGLELDSQGRLLVCVGGLTNAGVADCAMGGLPESPLSAAIVRAAIDEPGFEGAITYIHVDTGLPVDDQVLGEEIELADDVAVEVFASGLRNVFDLHLTTRDVLFALDNGPNGSLGPASLSATTEGPGPGEADELILLEEGHYYGHPNRSRGREDDRQNVYHRPVGASVPGAFTQALVRMPPSSNGLDEYRAATFGSQLRGHLIAQDFNEETYHVELSGDGRRFVDRRVLLEDFGGLDVVTAPGGVIFGIDFVSGVVRLARPQHATAVGVELFDIHPWRAPPEGGTSFVLAGRGFGALAETELRIDGRLAALTEVTPTRIRGAIPMRGDEPLGLLDVTVTTSGESTTLTDAFRYLSPVMPGARVDEWESAPVMPVALGEVAGGIIDDRLYLVGEGWPATLVFDSSTGEWLPLATAATRPFPGHHHAAEVVDGRLHLIGGLGGDSEGRVQVYDPEENRWTLAARLPFAAGSVATGLIGSGLVACGGIVDDRTVADCAFFDPSANTWTSLAPLPLPRNHAAAVSDGRRFWVIGGRGPGSGDGNVPADGFADVQCYDLATNTWQSSAEPGSSLVPLPQERGGMGKAVFHRGELYVIGGETLTGAGAGPDLTYDRVDVYDPVANTWRLGAALPTARHGIFPLLHAGTIVVAGGGPVVGSSASRIVEIYTP